MFVIFGIKSFNKAKGALVDEHSCPNCNARMNPVMVRKMTFFTLFFIPVIPVYIKNHLVCTECSHLVKISMANARALALQQGPQQEM